MGRIQADYQHIRGALEDVRSKGYGVVMPSAADLQLAEPEIVRKGGRYGVRLKASAKAIHMFQTNIETEVSPEIGGENASSEILGFLLQGFDGDVEQLWQSNIFGKRSIRSRRKAWRKNSAACRRKRSESSRKLCSVWSMRAAEH